MYLSWLIQAYLFYIFKSYALARSFLKHVYSAPIWPQLSLYKNIYIFYTSKYFRLKILNAKGWMELKEEVIFCVCVGVCVHKSLQNHLNG